MFFKAHATKWGMLWRNFLKFVVLLVKNSKKSNNSNYTHTHSVFFLNFKKTTVFSLCFCLLKNKKRLIKRFPGSVGGFAGLVQVC